MSEQHDATDLFTVSESETGLRLDKLLPLHFPHYSRTYFQELIDKGCIRVNGTCLKKREKPRPGDEIEVCFLLTPELSLSPEDIPLDILYEDEHLLAINKPAGMVVHPAPGHFQGTFVHALLYHCKNLPLSGDLRPGIVHRLDKETSGVLVAAKTREAHQALISLFSSRQIEKHYLAITVGNPGEGWIDAPIQRHPTQRKQMAVVLGGREAKSYCKVVAEKGELSLVEVQLITGRTHQIRVHLQYRGTPVLGDPVYGSERANKRYLIHRQLLHAHRMRLTHPITGIALDFTAPPPRDFLNFKDLF